MDKESFDLPIRRWEMAYILDNAFVNVYRSRGGENAEISDLAEIEKNYDSAIFEAIKSLVSFEIVKGDENGNFNPSGFGTRAEAVALINRSSEVMDNITAEIEAYYAELQKQQEEHLKQQDEAVKASNITYDTRFGTVIQSYNLVRRNNAISLKLSIVNFIICAQAFYVAKSNLGRCAMALLPTINRSKANPQFICEFGLAKIQS